LKGIAEHCEPSDPYVATTARVHALRCIVCWDAFGIASADAKARGHEPVPPMLRRVVAAIEGTAPAVPTDLNVN
jgi:hypothetical protein